MEKSEHRKQAQLLDISNSSSSTNHCNSKTIKSLLPQIIVGIIFALPQITTGIIYSYSSILIAQLTESNNNTNPDTLHVSKSEAAWIMSLPFLSIPVGAITGGVIMDWIGRLNLMKLMVIPYIVGYVIIATAVNVPMIIIGKILIGIVTTWGTNPALVYVAEVSTPDFRGPLSAFLMFNASLGMVLVVIKGWLLSWRMVAWLNNVYIIIFAILVMYLPESPAWLISKNRNQQAKKSLEWFNKYQPQPEDKVFAEIKILQLRKKDELKAYDDKTKPENICVKLKNLFLRPTVYKPFLIMIGVCFFQQFCGLVILIANGVVFLQEIGITKDSYLVSTFLGFVNLVMTAVCIWLIKRYGRRSLLITSYLGMAVSIGLSALFTKWIQPNTTTHAWILAIPIVFYYAFGTIGSMPIPPLLTAELFPIKIRGIAQSILDVFNFIAIFVLFQMYYALETLFGGAVGIQYFFAVMSLIGALYTYFLVPETRNKKLTVIQDYFVSNTIYVSLPRCIRNVCQSQKNLRSPSGSSDINDINNV